MFEGERAQSTIDCKKDSMIILQDIRKNHTTLFLAMVVLIGTRELFAQQEFPYALQQRDWLLAPLSVAFQVSGNALRKERDYNLTESEIASLNASAINSFDRIATEQWNTTANDWSNYLLHASPMVAAGVVLPHMVSGNWSNVLTLGVMVGEVYFFTQGVTDITKALSGRIRPYLYNETYTPEERFEFQGTKKGASTSFFSGHTSMTFSLLVFTSKVFVDTYGKGTWSTVVWCSTMAMAGTTAYLRVEAGKHFPTDVLAGALVGSAIGYFIPVLHKTTGSRLKVSLLPNGIYLVYAL